MRRVVFTAVLLLPLVLAACSGERTATNTPVSVSTPATMITPTPAGIVPVTATDSSGNVVTLPKPATRVFCATSCAGFLADLGIIPAASLRYWKVFNEDPRILGTKAQGIIYIDGGTTDPNLEQTLRAQPDLVVTLAGATALRDALKDKVAIFEIGSGTGAMSRVSELRALGVLTGRTQEAEAAITKFLDRFAHYKARAPSDQRVMVWLFYALPPPVENRSAPICGMLNEVAQCPWDFPGRSTNVVSLEKILEADPDVLFVQAWRNTETSDEEYRASQKDMNRAQQQMEQNPLYRELSAVKKGKVYLVERYIWRGEGLRQLSIVLDEAMPKLYPQVFPQPLP